MFQFAFQLIMLPFSLLSIAVVAFHAKAFWPTGSSLTGKPLRCLSLSSPVSPFDRIRSAALSYYAANGLWPDTYAALDPYDVLEFTQLKSVAFRTTETNQLTVTVFFYHGKGQFTVEPPPQTSQLQRREFN